MISLGSIIGGIAGGVIGFFAAPFLGIAVLAGVIGGAVIGTVAGDTLKAIINPDIFEGASNVSNAVAQNGAVINNLQGTDIAIPVIYGRRKVGGQRVFVSTGGDSNRYLYLVLTLSEGEIDAIERMYIDDQLAWTGETTHGSTYTLDTGRFSGIVTFQAFHGLANQTPSSLIQGGVGTNTWTSAHLLGGVAYVAFRLTYPTVTNTAEAEANPWSGGIPRINFILRGRKILTGAYLAYPVTDRATAYAAETDLYWSANPVDHLLDYLRNPLYGKGLPNDQINWNSFFLAANKWNLNELYLQLPQAQHHEGHSVIFTDRKIMDNVKTMLQNMRCSLPYSQGRFRLAVEDNGIDGSVYAIASNPVMTLNHTNIIGEISIEAENTQTKYNRVVVTYMGGGIGSDNPTYEAVELTYPTPGSALDLQYQTEDNNRLNQLDLTLEHIVSATTAHNLARIILQRSRSRSKTIGLTADSSAAVLDIGDIVTIQYGYSTRNYPGSSFTQTTPSGLVIDGKFRITNLTVNSDYTFGIIAAEHDDNIYGEEPEIVPEARAITRAAAGSGEIADIYYPSPSALSAAEILSIESYLTQRSTGQVTAVDVYVKYTEDAATLVMEYRLQSQTAYNFWQEVPAVQNSESGGVPAYRHTITGLDFGRTYVFRVQYRNPAGTFSPEAEATVTTVEATGNTTNYTNKTEFA
jgi:hypothetical protein